MVDTSPSARMQLVGIGDLVNPGCCMVCGSGVREEGYVDLRTYFDYEGQMYLCHTCVEQASELIGCLLPKEADFLREQVQQALADNALLLAEIEVSRERLNAFDMLIATGNSTADLSGIADRVAQPIAADGQPVDAAVTPAADGGESVVKESTPLPRRNDSKRSRSSDTTAAGLTL